MKLSWNSIKISIAGAKLTHLVQKDKVWDHGSIVEQVRTTFIYLKKAFLRNDPSIVRRCTTADGYKKISDDIELEKEVAIIDAELLSIEIIAVITAKNHRPDKFKALLKLQKNKPTILTEPVGFYKTNRLTEQEWLFVREGNWWLLDEIIKIKSFSQHIFH
jgi:hypothetical protein